jgi:hypothetical protein
VRDFITGVVLTTLLSMVIGYYVFTAPNPPPASSQGPLTADDGWRPTAPGLPPLGIPLTVEDALAILRFAQASHQAAVDQPELAFRGDPAWDRDWVLRYQGVIDLFQPSPSHP